MFRNRWIKFFSLLILCASLGLIDALKSYTSAYHDDIHYLEWIVALRWNLSAWSVWVVFIPLILWLSRRFWINQENWFRSVLFYFPLGLLFSFIKTIFPLLASLIFVDNHRAGATFITGRWYFLFTDFFAAFVFYCFVLAFAQAVNYYRQYREKELRTSQLESQLARAELQALKMQLHPHFLFNTLHSISALLYEDIRAAQKMMARLGDFLRLTLDNVGLQTVSLRHEIEFLECYLEIERVRFQERLTIEINIEPETLDAQMPNLILQPLLENAVRHGISSRISQGVIRISAKRENGSRLKLEVTDNGDGLKEPKNAADISQQRGLGLKNTQERLKQLYGSDYNFELLPAPEGGLTAALTIPLVFQETSAAAAAHVQKL